jgi:integrase
MSYLRLKPDAYDKLLEKDTATIQMDITDYIRSLKAGHSSGTISAYVAAIHKFYAMNDIQLNWTKIHSYEGEREKQTEDRPYTHDEIKLLVDRAKLRNRAIILLMASSGPRVGALPLVRIRDLEPIDKYGGLYKITYYPKSKGSRYFSFCTPECRRAIDDYLDWRKRFGERLEPDTPLFRRDFNAAGNRASAKVKTIQVAAMTKSIHNLLKSVGLRPNISLENTNNDIKRRRF